MDATQTHEFYFLTLCPKIQPNTELHLDGYSMGTVCVHFPAQCLVDSVSLHYGKHLLDGMDQVI